MKRVLICLVSSVVLLSLLPGLPANAAGQERRAIKLDPRVYDAYVGKYQLTPDFVITVRREENGLSVQATNQPKFEIFAESETRFFLTAVDAQITFVKNEKAEVTHLILHQGGADQQAKKIGDSTAETSGRSATGTAPAQRPIDMPVDMLVPIVPTAFKGDGKTHLVYELHLTNFAPMELTLSRLEVLSTDGKVVAKYEDRELSERIMRPGLASSSDKQRLGGGMRAVLFLWVTFDSASVVPAAIRHRLTTRIGGQSGGGGEASAMEVIGEGPEIKVRTDPIVLSPPLPGSQWVALNGPSNISGHRRAMFPFGGAARIAQRFAIDWVQLGDNGQTFTGDRLKNQNYRCYGVEALAVGSGTVSAIKDGIPENIPGPTSRAVPITIETVGGNHVILDLGGGRYAFYAHLQPGSLRVKVGDKVKRGQVLGLVGNSGNSTEPHLHFHISNSNSPLASEGLPYVIESFEVQGKGMGWKPSSESAVDRRRMEIPLQNAVVRFSDKK